MDEVCVFARPTGNCSALRDTVCNGKDKNCSFYKTEKQYIADRNRAVRLNRRKGLCDRCPYHTNKCRLLTEKDPLGGLDYD